MGALKSYPSWKAHPRLVNGDSDPHRNWKLDKYRLHGKNNITNSDKSRKQSFTLSSEPRFGIYRNVPEDSRLEFEITAALAPLAWQSMVKLSESSFGWMYPA